MFHDPRLGAPGLDFQTWETLEAGVGENEKRQIEVHCLPHLKIEMWATQRYRSDMATRLLKVEMCFGLKAERASVSRRAPERFSTKEIARP